MSRDFSFALLNLAKFLLSNTYCIEVHIFVLCCWLPEPHFWNDSRCVQECRIAYSGQVHKVVHIFWCFALGLLGWRYPAVWLFLFFT